MTEHSIGSIEALADGRGTKVEIGDELIAVFRVDEAVYAIADRCSHAEASLAEGELFGLDVECPRHGAEFNIATGAQASLPATKPVQVYPTSIVEGEVFLTIGEEVSDA